ncbi:hypothetical protein ACLOJK_021955 [Asimina triloba]
MVNYRRNFDNGIVLAPIGVDVAGPKLVSAVANTGGIGLLASPVNNYDMTQKAIKETKKLTSKPFGAGILVEFDNTRTIQAIFDEKLACMQVYWGDYPKEMVDEAHKHGEAYAHNYYKQRLLHYTEADTDYTDLYYRASWRAPVRCLNTPFHNQWKNAPESAENNEEQPIIGYSIIYGGETVLRRFAGQVANPTTSGELENMVMYAGQGVGLIKDILPAGEIIKNFVEGAKEIITNLNKKYIGGAEETSAASAAAPAASTTSS